jgi:hypothetical protein
LCNESSGCFGGDSLDKSVKAIEDCAKLCCIGLKIVLSRITALQFSLIFLNRIRLQAHVHLGQVEIPVKALSGNWIHSNGDAGLHGPRRIMVGYLKHFLADLSRSGSTRASMSCNPPNAASDFFFGEAEILNNSLLF